MAIANFGDLKTAINDWLNRSDLSAVPLGQFVLAVENDLRSDAEIREYETIVTGTMSGDGFALPTDFLRVRSLLVENHPYTYLPPDEYSNKVDNESTGWWYTINGSNVSVLNGDGKDYELLYFGNLPALSASGDTNWILKNHPNIYLWGGCYFGSVFLKDTNGMSAFSSLYETAKGRLHRGETKARFGTNLQVRPG